MKIFFFAIGFIFIADSSAYSQKKRTVFYGSFSTEHPDYKLKSTMKEAALYDGILTATNILKSKDNFKYVVYIEQPSYFLIGRNTVYLAPGDSVEAVVNSDYPSKSIFKGKSTQINDYLKSTPLPKGGSFVYSGDSIKKTLETSILNIFQSAYQRKAFLTNQISLPKKFRDFEENRIECDIYNSLFYLYGYYPYVNKLSDSSKQVFYVNYKTLIDPLLNSLSVRLTDSKLLDLPVYRNIMDDVAKRNKNFRSQKNISDFLLAYEYILKISSISSYEDLIELKDTLLLFKQSEYKNLLKDFLDSKLKFTNGDIVFSFPLLDSTGLVKELKSLKGKIIYIDIWATWCKPCLEEFKFLDSLQKKFTDKSDIVFISISVDDNPDIWKSFLKKNELKGEQYYTQRQKLSAYDVNTLPRAILIDKDFKVVEIQAPLPSSKSIAGLLQNLLEK